jgi:hypothetical protein
MVKDEIGDTGFSFVQTHVLNLKTRIAQNQYRLGQELSSLNCLAAQVVYQHSTSTETLESTDAWRLLVQCSCSSDQYEQVRRRA